jgi:hypothetical protein
MAYNFVIASARYLSTASAPATGTPMTIASWGKTSTPLTQASVSVGDNSSTQRNQLQWGLGPSVNTPRVVAIGATAQNIVIGTSNSWNGQWNHHCGLFTSATSRSIFFNGVNENTGTINIGSQNAATNVTIGARFQNSAVGAYFEGDLADVGIWNVALTADEIASLAKGVACNLVRPQSLVFYAPLVRDLIDVRGGRTITNNNGATVVNHPRIYQ